MARVKISFEDAVKMGATKVCKTCESEKSVVEFGKKKSGKFGVASECKCCLAKSNKAYRSANEEALTEKRKAYYSANRETILEKKKVYQSTNKEKIAEKMKAYQSANKEKIAKNNKAYRSANKEKIAEKRKAHYSANRETILEQKKAYRSANEEALTEKRKAYYSANKEELNKKSMAYYSANREALLEKKKVYQSTNKEKIAEKNKAYHSANKKELNKKSKAYHSANKKALAEKKKAYQSANREAINNHTRERRATDPQFAIAGRLRTGVRSAIRSFGNGSKGDKTLNYLGCTLDEFIAHLEVTYELRYGEKIELTAENLKDYEIDHIVPISRYNLTIEENIARSTNYQNFQLLTVEDNRSKSDKIGVFDEFINLDLLPIDEDGVISSEFDFYFESKVG